MKKIIAALGLFATLALAAPAMAQSVVPSYGGYATAYTTTGYAQPSCPSLSYNLYFGLSDYRTQGQVSALQQFLAARGYHQPVTGYFGGITRNNVASFQRQYNISPITGGVGPITRSVIAQTCQGGGSTSGTFSLGVPFTVTPNQTLAQYGGQLDFTLTSIATSPYTYTIYPGYNPATSATITLGQRCQAGTYCFYYPQQQFTMTLGQTVTWMGYSVTLQNLTSGSATFVVTQGGTIGGVTVSSPSAGQTYSRGQDMTIAWGYPVTPNSTQMMLELYSASGARIGLIAVSASTSGSYTWHIPGFPQNYMCTMQYPNGLCGTSIPNGKYYIKVSASNNPFDSSPSIIASGQSGTFTMTGAGGCTSNCSTSFSASPTQGSAPLAVQFTSTGPQGSDIGATVSFGDGTSGNLAFAPVCSGCNAQGSVSHTYGSNGTYTAQLLSASGSVLGTATVYVGTSQYGVTASPVSGAVPFTTTFTLNNYSGSYFVNYGDGTSASLVSGSTSHTYYNRGTYTATFTSDYACLHSTPACQIAQQNLGSVTVTVN